jgi:hypothetical protein
MMKLVELAYFTDNVETMENFYRNLLGVEPVAGSNDMAIYIWADEDIHPSQICSSRR